MKTYIFTFDVNGGDDIKTGILQTQNKHRNGLPKDLSDVEMVKEIIKRCIIRFVNVNESNLRVLEERFWKCICCDIKRSSGKKIEINMLGFHEIADQNILNERISDASKKYDIFINCCNIDPTDDYFIFEGQKVIFLNQNDYTTKQIQVN